MKSEEIRLNRELIELKSKVLKQRINRLYNIFIVLAQDGKFTGELNSILVIKEQYDKMCEATLEREEYNKYQEVEDTIISKLAGIEYKLDTHIYRTAKQCKQILESHISQIENSDNYTSRDKELEKIKALQEILKLYAPYIKPEQKQNIERRLSKAKFDILIKQQILGMTLNQKAGIGSLASCCDNKDEKERFKEFTKGRFPEHKEDALLIIQDEDKMSNLLRNEILGVIAKYQKRIEKVHGIIKFLCDIGKTNETIDFSKEFEEIQLMQGQYMQMHEAVLNGQYSTYFQIQKDIIPDLEAMESKLEEYSSNNIENILDILSSKEYEINKLLEENSKNYDELEPLEDLIRMHKSHKVPSEFEKYYNVLAMCSTREGIREAIFRDYYFSPCVEEQTELAHLAALPFINDFFYMPVFLYGRDNGVSFDKHIDYFPYEWPSSYISTLLEKPLSIMDLHCLCHTQVNNHLCIDEERLQTYPQRLIYALWKKRCKSLIMGRNYNFHTTSKAYYLVTIDKPRWIKVRECTHFTTHWPIGEECKFGFGYPDSYSFSHFLLFSDLGDIYIKTDKILLKGLKSENPLPLDETKMREIPNEVAEKMIEDVIKKRSPEGHRDSIIEDIFSLWPETEENKQERERTRNSLSQALDKMHKSSVHNCDREPPVKSKALYEAIIKEMRRIRETEQYQNCRNMKEILIRILYLMNFVEKLLDVDYEQTCEIYHLGNEISFDITLRQHIEAILYHRGRAEYYGEYPYEEPELRRRSRFGWDDIRFAREYFGEDIQNPDYEDIESWILNNNLVNDVILKNMNSHPERYLCVLSAPTENSIVPAETREKIAEYAKQFEIEATDPTER